jgi:hypothetical protein
MKPSLRSTGWKNYHEWVSAIGTLLVLSWVYASMDNFSSYAPAPKETINDQHQSTLSVAPAYWNKSLGYGFRSIAWDVYEASTTDMKDVVSVKNSIGMQDANKVTVSYYKNTSLESIEPPLEPYTPRAYSQVWHGIAVIEGNLDSARAKTIFSTLHSD